MSLNNLKLQSRLGLGFGIVLALLVVIGVFTYTRLVPVEASVELLVKDRFVKVAQANDAIDQINLIARALRNMLLMTEPAKIEAEDQRILEARTKTKEIWEKLEASITSEEGKRLMKAILDARATYNVTQDEVRRMAKEGKRAEATALLLGTYREQQNAYMNTVM